MTNQRGGTRMDTVVKLVLMFFVSLLSFSAGTFVGKGFSDSEYMEAALEKGEYKGFKDATEQEDGHGAEEGLSDEEISSLTDEFVNNEKRDVASEKSHGEKPHGEGHHDDGHGAPKTEAKAHADAHGYKKVEKPGAAKAHAETETGKHKTEAHKAESHKADTHKAEPHKADAPHAPAKKSAAADHGRDVAHAAQRVAEGKAPAADPKAQRKPDSILPSVATSSVGKFTVQVASYPSEDEAKNHAAVLKGKGFSAFYVPAEVKNQTWYRVSVGLFANSESAQEFRKELMKDGSITTAIVQKIVK